MAKPTTFQQLLNNMLPPKVVNGITYVPRITQAKSGEIQTFVAVRDGRQHGGIDVLYGQLHPKNREVENVSSTDPINRNVLIGAPTDGILRIVSEGSNKLAIIEDADGVKYVIRHMSNLPLALDGRSVQAGTVIGTMSNVGMNGGAVHDHLSIYSSTTIEGKIQRVAVDPYTFYQNKFDYSKTDLILLVDQKRGDFGTTGRYIPSEIISDKERIPAPEKIYIYDEKTPLSPVRIGGINALREYLVGLEGGGDYLAVNSHGALGAYQMLPDALKQTKYQDASGQWTGKDGVSSKEDFLTNKAAQDNAFLLYIEAVKKELVANEAWSHLGRTLPDGTVITEGSLIGAGWLGAGNVAKYLKSDGDLNRTDSNGASVGYRLRSFSRFDPSLSVDDRSTSTPAALAAPTNELWERVTSSYVAVKKYLGLTDPAGTDGLPVSPNQTSGNPLPREATQSVAPPLKSDFTWHKDGSFALSFTAKADSTNGTVKKGDVVTQNFDPSGTLKDFSVKHTEGNETTVMKEIPGAVEGQPVRIFSHWVGGTLNYQRQWDSARNPVVSLTTDGLTYKRAVGSDGQIEWLDPNGLNDAERKQQSYAQETQRLFELNPVMGDPEYVSPKLQQSFDQETQRLFKLHPINAEQESVGLRPLSDEERNAWNAGLAQVAMAGTGKNYADAGNYTGSGSISDGGPGATGSLNLATLPTSNLVRHFADGKYLTQLADFDVIRLNENTSALLSAHGEMAGEVSKLPTGYLQIKTTDGITAYVSEKNGDLLTKEKYEQVQTEIQQATQAANAVSLMNSIIGLQHWQNMSDLQRTAAVVSIYNAVDKIAGDKLPGDLGTAASVLGLMNALEKGNVGGMLVSGISLVDALGKGAASAAIGKALDMPAGQVVPCLSLLLALDSGDPMAIAAAAANFIPVYGQVISLAITVLGGLFGDEPDIPMREGLAHAEWDAAGNVVVVTDQDVEEGGATATEWMKSLVNGLQTQLAAARDAAGNATHALVPGLLPAVGFQYDPDGFNLANGAKGYVYLKWVDAHGETQTRYYDGAGSRGDGSGETLAGDFMRHAAGAIAAAWQVQTVLAHYQQGNGLVLPDAAAGLPQVLADGLHQALQAIALVLPDEERPAAMRDTLADIDGDGFLEPTQWLAARQQALAVDANGDGAIDANELLSLGGTGPASLHSMNWLDANHDKILDARDPAFAALRVWVDADGNGSSAGGSDGNAETQTLAEAGIVAIDFGSSPPAAVRADSSRTPLATQQLVGDVLGVQYQAVVGGVLQLDEQLSGPAVATLHAVNTREFDGLTEHMHGGEAALNVDTDGFNGENPARHALVDAVVDAGDERLVSTTAHTLATQSAQTRTTLAAGDSRLRIGTGLATSTGAGATFTPLGATGLGAQMRDAQDALARSADASSLTPLLALAVSAAVQWPALASAAPQLGQPGADGALPAAQPGADMTGWQIWSGAGVSATAFATFPASALNARNTQNPQPEENPFSAGTGVSMLLDTNPDSSSTTAGESYASNWPLAQDTYTPYAPDLIANGVSAQAAPASTQASPQPFSSPSNGEVAPAPAPNQATGPMATEVRLAPPQVQGEQAATREDTGLRFLEGQLLANDSTPYTPAQPGATGLRITSVFAPEHGSVSVQVNAQGGTEVVFLPEANYNGPASFRYTVTDSYGLCSDASMSLNISAVNDAPTVLGETATGDEDTTLLFTTGGLLANDSDIDNPQADLRIVSVDNAVHGAVSLHADGTIRFVPDVDYFGPAQFTYTVADGVGGFTVGLASLNIAPVNDAPRLADDAATLDEDTEARFTAAALLANDADIDNPHGDLTITAVGNASHGSVQWVDGEIVFTPDINFNGAASFSYTVSDGVGGAGGVDGVGGLNSESQATVTLTFNPVNDAPVTNDELLWGKRDVSYTLTQAALLANDIDVESPTASLRISAVSNAQHGTAVLNADGSVRFVPEAGYAGRGSFDYLVQDPEGATTTATAQIDFSHINTNPLATDDGFTGYEDIAFNITAAQLLVNDSDADNAAGDLRVAAVANAQNGTVLLQADGSVRFVPVENFYGTASFQYQVADGDGGNTWATARLTVQSVNDAPVIEDIWYGRPLYGFAGDVAVHDEAQARALAATGSLLSRTLSAMYFDQEGYVDVVYDYATVTPSYYRNGAMRPLSTDSLDATFYSPNNPFKLQNGGNITRWAMDDPYRQGGGVVAYDPDGDSSAISFRIGSSPQHGHAWANQYTHLQADRDLDHTQAPANAVMQTGAWQYYSHRGDPYDGADPFTIIATDGSGASTLVTINTAHVGLGAGGGGGKPVTLDLDGDGLQYVGLDDSRAYFDLNHDGWRERLAWAGEGDALLARDIGSDGVIARADEISFAAYLPGARTDLEGLAAFDSNGNGLLDKLDARWQEFGAWRDTHGDGVSAPGEFLSLDDIGITQIDLRSDQQLRQFDGVTELGQSRFTWADGHTGAVGDVAFAADESDRLPAFASTPSPTVWPPATTLPTPLTPLTPEHMALLMAQVISTATAAWEMNNGRESGEGIPLGYVEQGGHDAHQALAATQAQWADAAQAQAAQFHGLAA